VSKKYNYNMDEGLKNKAYLEGSRLKNAGYDNEVIYARLEKLGASDELARQVIFNLSVQKAVDTDKEIRPFYYLAIFKIGIGVFLAILSAFILPGQVYLPIGLIFSGIIYATLTKKKMI
jgi:hypothetical protein